MYMQDDMKIEISNTLFYFFGEFESNNAECSHNFTIQLQHFAARENASPSRSAPCFVSCSARASQCVISIEEERRERRINMKNYSGFL